MRRFLSLHGVKEGVRVSELDPCEPVFDLWELNLAEMLLAGLQYVKSRYSPTGRKGLKLDTPGTDSWETGYALAEELSGIDVVAIDDFLNRLFAIKNLRLIDDIRRPHEVAPRVYPYRGAFLNEIDLSEQTFGVVAEEDWLRRSEARDAAFDAALPDNAESHTFQEISLKDAERLAASLLTEPQERLTTGRRSEASAIVTLFGPSSTAFALAGTDIQAPFEKGHPWSQYEEDGRGCWGETCVLIVASDYRLAYLDRVWNTVNET